MINQLKFTATYSKASGFTLVEVMIALVIFSVGLLGLAGLHASSMQNNKASDMRGIAIIQAHDMADRIRANTRGTSGDYNAITTGIPAAGTNCITTASCTSPASIAAWDNFEWQTNLNTFLPSGRGTVTRATPTSTVVITVMWDEARTGALGEGCSGNPAVDLKCFRMEFLP